MGPKPNWLHPQQQQQPNQSQHHFTFSDNKGYFWSYNSGNHGNTEKSDIRRSKSCERLAPQSPSVSASASASTAAAMTPPSAASQRTQNLDCKSCHLRQTTSHSNLFACGSEKMARKKKTITITPAVNVYMTTMSMEYISRHEMLTWVNRVLGSDYQSIGELGNGIAYCQFMNMLFPGLIPLNKVKYRMNLRHEAVQNFELLQMAFNKVQVDKVIPSQKLINGRFRDNFEFLKWFRKFYAANYVGAVHPFTKHFEIQFSPSCINHSNNGPPITKSMQNGTVHGNSPSLSGSSGPTIIVNEDQRFSSTDGATIRHQKRQRGWQS